jgi:prevent-host-death family protein
VESVGVRELKDRLSHYLRAVQQGEIVTVTVRRRPVARLVPIASRQDESLPEDLERRMWELAGKGLLSWRGQPPQLPEPVASNRGSVLLSDIVIDGRE